MTAFKVKTDQHVPPFKFNLVVFDPGETVGVCEATLDVDANEVVTVHWETRTTLWPAEANSLMWDVIRAQGVVCEDWRLYEDKAEALVGDPLAGNRCAGFIQGVCNMTRTDLTWQQPGEKDSAYAALAMFVGKDNVPKTEHEKDALSHLIRWLMK